MRLKGATRKKFSSRSYKRFCFQMFLCFVSSILVVFTHPQKHVCWFCFLHPKLNRTRQFSSLFPLQSFFHPQFMDFDKHCNAFLLIVPMFCIWFYFSSCFPQYGEVLNLLISSKKTGSAVVEFATVKAAVSCCIFFTSEFLGSERTIYF